MRLHLQFPLFTIIFSLFLFSLIISAQDYTGDILLKNQSEIDAFNYKKVSGAVIIHEETPGAIYNLDGLSELVRASKLTISNNLILNNLNGLLQLKVLDTLEITGNVILDNLNGLSGLTDLAHLYLHSNFMLTNINALSHITTIIWGHLEIINNPLLENFDALKMIGKTSITRIEDNARLKTLDGLAGMVCAGHVYIKNNPSLENINGLHRFNNMGQFFEIINNDALTNLDSLKSFTTVQELTIQDNDALTSIKGLSNIAYAFHLRIINNDALQNIDPLFPAFKKAYGITINDNDLLQNINGLGKVDYIDFVLNIKNNSHLTDISGLSSLYDVRTVIIKDHVMLSEFCGLYTAATGADSNKFFISGNAKNPTKAQIAAAGACGTVVSAVENDNSGITPSEFCLKQNYPNPFNPSTVIEYELPEQEYVILNLYNSLGELVKTLFEGSMNSGRYKYILNASGLPCGVYMYKLQAGTFTKTMKLVYLK